MGVDNKRKILCVEDHADTCELVTAVLPEFEVISVATETDAVEKVRDGDFAVVLMDYHLLDGTGEDACIAIRGFDRRTPILFITSTSSITQAKALAIGAQGLLRKATSDFVEHLRRRVAELVPDGIIDIDLSFEET